MNDVYINLQNNSYKKLLLMSKQLLCLVQVKLKIK